MNVLIACEESQRVCVEFRRLGHKAFSCDLQECSGGHPEWHIKGDCLPLLNGNCGFTTQYGDADHFLIGKWDLIIAHPPCTRLCSSGQRWLYTHDPLYNAKKKHEQKEAIAFFKIFTELDCDHVAIENPVGIMSRMYRKPDQIYNPYNFYGETDRKKTCLWLKGLPKLKFDREDIPNEKKTNSVWLATFDGKHYGYSDPKTAVLRSKTPVGVAKAMAEQWGGVADENK